MVHQPDIKNIKVLYIYSVSANMIDIPTERYVEFLIYTSFNLIYVFEIKYNFAKRIKLYYNHFWRSSLFC